MVCVLVWLAIAVTAAAGVERKAVLPDPSTGNVNGLAGLLYWPIAMKAAPRDPPQPFPTADGCDVHLVPDADPDRELTYPCGKWFAPPRGKYILWMELDGAMSPSLGLVNYSRSPFQGRGLAAFVSVAPAGRVGIPAGRSLPQSETLRVLSIETSHWWNKGAWLFYRRVTPDRANHAVQMPAGDVVVGRFDRKTNDAIALARPVNVQARRTQMVWPVPPVASDLLVILDKPPQLQLSKTQGSSRVLLNDGTSDRRPDVLVDARDQLVAIWYGLELSRATLSLQSDVALWESREVHLSNGKVTTVRSELRSPPKN